jgi:hypothetical protein
MQVYRQTLPRQTCVPPVGTGRHVVLRARSGVTCRSQVDTRETVDSVLSLIESTGDHPLQHSLGLAYSRMLQNADKLCSKQPCSSSGTTWCLAGDPAPLPLLQMVASTWHPPLASR